MANYQLITNFAHSTYGEGSYGSVLYNHSASDTSGNTVSSTSQSDPGSTTDPGLATDSLPSEPAYSNRPGTSATTAQIIDRPVGSNLLLSAGLIIGGSLLICLMILLLKGRRKSAA